MSVGSILGVGWAFRHNRQSGSQQSTINNPIGQAPKHISGQMADPKHVKLLYPYCSSEVPAFCIRGPSVLCNRHVHQPTTCVRAAAYTVNRYIVYWVFCFDHTRHQHRIFLDGIDDKPTSPFACAGSAWLLRAQLRSAKLCLPSPASRRGFITALGR